MWTRRRACAQTSCTMGIHEFGNCATSKRAQKHGHTCCSALTLFEKPTAEWIGRAANLAGANVNSNNICTFADALRQHAQVLRPVLHCCRLHIEIRVLIPVLCFHLYLDSRFFLRQIIEIWVCMSIRWPCASPPKLSDKGFESRLVLMFIFSPPPKPPTEAVIF
jgi:hypothetical protein